MSIISSYTQQPSYGYVNGAQNGRGVALEYGIYRDGDNNLDAAEAPVIPQAIAVSKADPAIQMTVEDTTELNGNGLRTYDFILDGGRASEITRQAPVEMSQRAVLARFVATTLDNAERSGAKETWIELVDHGAGDAGGLFTVLDDQSIGHLSEDDLAGAIADGIALHAQRHPEDANRRVDGIVMHECFELTMGVSESLSSVGVKYLAASPETTIAPGVPSTVAIDIERNIDNPQKMADAAVRDVLLTRYRQGNLVYGPTAAFDVLDLSPVKMQKALTAEQVFNETTGVALQKDPALRRHILHDARKIPGMERDDPSEVVPWRGDRPAIALYMSFATDKTLPPAIRKAALQAAQAIAAPVMAHGETVGAVGFGADYRDAVGPTTRFPTKMNQIDPLSPEISETACSYAYISGRNALIQTEFRQGQGNAAAAA